MCQKDMVNGLFLDALTLDEKLTLLGATDAWHRLHSQRCAERVIQSLLVHLNSNEIQDIALLTFVSRFADLRQQICRPSSADLPTFVSRFADHRQQ